MVLVRPGAMAEVWPGAGAEVGVGVGAGVEAGTGPGAVLQEASGTTTRVARKMEININYGERKKIIVSDPKKEVL